METEQEEKYYSKLEKIYVHNVYESISSQYDEFFKLSQINNASFNPVSDQSPSKHNVNRQETNGSVNGSPGCKPKSEKKKYKAWPKVSKFLLSQEPKSFVADIGCGEGKYLNINSQILTIGCDYSSSLCHLASSMKTVCVSDSNQVLICDNLSLPFRSDLFDAVISIGVIHHFSSMSRRVKALQELSRILRPGGKMMIYVWALEQRLRKFNGQDVLVPMLNTCPTGLPLKKAQFNLRRELSNNSATSDDESNEKKLDLILQAQNKNNAQATIEIDQIDSRSSSSLNFEASHLTSNFLNFETSSLTSRTKTHCSLEQDLHKNRFIDNIKYFFARRFNTTANFEDSQTKSEQNSPSTINSKNIGNQFNFDEKYKLILEQHKEILPKNFTIRKFPQSSYPSTFDISDDSKPLSNEESSKDPTDSVFDENSACSTSNSFQNDQETSNPPMDSSSKDNIFEDDNNNSNKRFYHVFKNNELDEMIKEHCPALTIYESYYDHGNWSICAVKQSE